VFDLGTSLAIHPEEVELAIWFHDAVYDTRCNDNEQRSADWAELVIRQAGLCSEIAERVSRSILATRHNVVLADTDEQVVADIDLSILGREANVFWQYEANIRKEYAWVPEAVFRRRRAEILQGFLDRRYIYYHENYRHIFETTARVNLGQAILRLSGGVS
jgi:predicted metal-dependent HD superfamily phosphohydrolase